MGVKSLWELLSPVGRPVMLETVEGKTMAIDSSIWIYQFQATMRDKEGRGLMNAHVLGFLRRITKLMFYGIKPVFVFDGGAPVLKRSTLAERKQKKLGAAASHAKVAEKLLAAQLRRHAVDEAQARQRAAHGDGRDYAGPAPIDDNTVYLEDVDPSAPKTSPRKPAAEKRLADASPAKSKWQDHDPYRLPDVDLPAVFSRAADSLDPRLATEEELRDVIDALRPEDIDVTAPEFRALPTEVQYEIIGDLRLRSRQTSHARLQNMLRHARTSLDFSREQIRNLQQRNALTQQLFVTTDSIGKVNVSIPVRIASERNRQYVLVKNEGVGGGWILGLRPDEGTKAKPIRVDIGSDEEAGEAQADEDSDMEMEEVEIPPVVPTDPDLREYQRTMALEALSKRQSPKGKKLVRSHGAGPAVKKKQIPLFVADDGDDVIAAPAEEEMEDADIELDLAMQESLDDAEAADLIRAIEQSKSDLVRQPGRSPYRDAPHASTSKITAPVSPLKRSYAVFDGEDDGDNLYGSPSRLATALSIGGAGPSRRPPISQSAAGTSTSPIFLRGQRLSFGTASASAVAADLGLKSSSSRPPAVVSERRASSSAIIAAVPVSKSPTPSHTPIADNTKLDYEDDEVEVAPSSAKPPAAAVPSAASGSDMQTSISEFVDHDEAFPGDDIFIATGLLSGPLTSTSKLDLADTPQQPLDSDLLNNGVIESDEDEDMEEVDPVLPNLGADISPSKESVLVTRSPPWGALAHQVPTPGSGASVDPSFSVNVAQTAPLAHYDLKPVEDEDDEEPLSGWSRSPSPAAIGDQQDAHPPPPATETADWDAAQEMDAQAEEGEFARFAAHVKGRDLDAVRREIDEEIGALNEQRRVAARDSEDVTGQMVAQIMTMLRLFGIPYITAPMEAEAQCAALVELGLVDGIITDDSDVFLFGGLRVFKNMFNQSKTVECFLLADLARELGLERDTLIRLAYLLGSDYVDGLPGVGPVVAMELLKEFPGEDGLHKFKDWWVKVQMGRDKADDIKSKFRKRFKKRFKETLFLPEEWPNPAVRDAYYHPTVDGSNEPFKWGLPDLDALRSFFHAELGWNQSKVDDLLLPVIQKQGKRNQIAALNKQGNLNGFLDIAGGSGTVAPRKRQAYASKRLQQIVSDFRSQQAKLDSGGDGAGSEADDAADGEGAGGTGGSKSAGSGSESEYGGTGTARKRKQGAKGKPAAKKARSASRKEGVEKAATRGRGRGRGRARGRGRGVASASGRKGKGKAEAVGVESDEDAQEDETFTNGSESPPPAPVKPRPRPRPRARAKRKEDTPEVDGDER